MELTRKQVEEREDLADNLIFKQAFHNVREEQFFQFLTAKGERSFTALGRGNGPVLSMLYMDGCRWCHSLATELAPAGFEVQLPRNQTTGLQGSAVDEDGTSGERDGEGKDDDKNVAGEQNATAEPEQNKRVNNVGRISSEPRTVVWVLTKNATP